MSFKSTFSTSCETRELHSDPQLRTRYYRNNFKQVLEVIEKLQKELDFDIRNVDQTHGEVYMISNGFEIIATIIQVTPIETGVDFKVNFFSFIGLGRPKKQAVRLFQALDKELKFKGVALHP